MKPAQCVLGVVCLAVATGCVRSQPSSTRQVTASEQASASTPQVTASEQVSAPRAEATASVAHDASVSSEATSRQVDAVNGKLVFDAVACERAHGMVYWGMGSVAVNVLGKQDNRCVFEYRNEVEGGYSDHVCRVAATGTIRVEETSSRPMFSWSASECQARGGGNLLAT